MSRSSPNPEMQDLVRRLLAHEAAGKRPTNGRPSATFRVAEKLRLPLCKLVGTMGYRAVMERALANARQELPALSSFYIDADGSMAPVASVAESSVAAAAEALLIAQFFSLLSAFVGRGLLLHVVVNVWPDFQITASESSKGRTYDPSRES